MSDKKYQYKDIENDKSLINKIPNQSDLEGFEEWKKKTNKRILDNCIFSGVIIGFISFLSISGVMSSGESLKDKIIVLLFLAIFILFEIRLIKHYLNSRTWQMEYCNYGKVIDKYRVTKGKKKRFYVIIEVDGNLFKIKSRSQYFSLEINDDATVFSIEGKEFLGVMKK